MTDVLKIAISSYGDCINNTVDRSMQMKRDNILNVCLFCNSATLNIRGLPPFIFSILSDFTLCNSCGTDLTILFGDLCSTLFTEIYLWYLPVGFCHRISTLNTIVC